MKTFLITSEDIGRSGKVETNIYRIKNNIPEYLGDIKYNRGSFKGHTSETLRFLFDNKHISQNAYNASVNKHRGFGYYDSRIHPDKFGVRIINL